MRHPVASERLLSSSSGVLPISPGNPCGNAEGVFERLHGHLLCSLSVTRSSNFHAESVAIAMDKLHVQSDAAQWPSVIFQTSNQMGTVRGPSLLFSQSSCLKPPHLSNYIDLIMSIDLIIAMKRAPSWLLGRTHRASYQSPELALAYKTHNIPSNQHNSH